MTGTAGIRCAVVSTALLAIVFAFASMDSSARTERPLPAPSPLDPSFGSGGIRVMDLGQSDVIEALALQNDGKIVAVGQTQLATLPYSTDFAVTRYQVDGSLDSGFGAGGVVRTRFGGNENRAFGVAVQADGKVVVAGVMSGGSTGADIALARYNGDGSLDPSFGTGGKVVTDFFSASTHELALDLVIQPNGKILVAGGTHKFGPITLYPDNFAVARYDPNGTLDPSFGGDGKVSTDFGLHDRAYGIALAPDGKVVVAGLSADFATQRTSTALVRYGADGTLDPTFGAQGLVLTPDSSAEEVVVQADGKVLTVGGAGETLAVRRYATDGALDPTFGEGGVARADFRASSSLGRTLALERNGTIVAAGHALFDAAPQARALAVARFTPTGRPDRSFHGGAVSTAIGTAQRAEARGVVVQPDRKIIIGGGSAPVQPDGQSGSADFVLVRYLSPFCRVPNVRGKKLGRAKSMIRKSRCSAGKIRRKSSTRARKGRVLSQRPKAGTTLAVGGKVNLVVGKGHKR